MQDYRCALGGCGAALEAGGGANVVCSGCRAVVYCDVECQTAHWAAHMDGCFAAVVMRVHSGDVHQGDEGGEYVLRDRLQMWTKKLGASHERTLICMGSLGKMMELQGKLAEAGELYRDRLAICRTAFDPTHKITLSSMNDLALLLLAQGNLVEAVPLMRAALKL